MAFEIREYPEWSWSQTRDAIFKDCARKYYFHYYASHNGWLREASEESKFAYRLKQLANLYILFGDALHQLVERILRESLDKHDLSFNQDNFIYQLRNYLNRAFMESKNVEKWIRAPKRSMMLHEIYYEGNLPKNRIAIINERINQCGANLQNSKSLQELLLADNKILEIEELYAFLVEGHKVYVKIDVLFHAQTDDQWIIVDWKTGHKDEGNEDQLLLYAMFLKQKYDVPYEKIEIRLEYLLTGQRNTFLIDGEKVERMKTKVLKSINEMKTLLEDEQKNKPLPMEKFPVMPTKLKCKSCNYRAICKDKTI
jgi:CRISPR/Cas system-associated exonuclease Cas4 (RecB family)